MSSENLTTKDNQLFTWTNQEADDYLFATYHICTPLNGEQAAFGIAKEQSVCATSLATFDITEDTKSFAAKVVSVEPQDFNMVAVSPLYFLNTSVYGDSLGKGEHNVYRVVIAYPAHVFGNRLTRIWNNVMGEIHRLGFLSSAILIDVDIPNRLAQQFIGPRYGIEGIQQTLGFSHRPILCRSMRPANGLDTNTMLAINKQVLTGGFDVIKDDELTYDSNRSPFADRVQRMVTVKKQVEDDTGERKLYFANIIDDLDAALPMLEQAQKAGVDGVLVSSYIQGMSFISEVRQRSDMMILAHNTCGDVITRSAQWGATDGVMAKLHRLAGADLTVGPGPIATNYQNTQSNSHFIEACTSVLGGCKQTMPIIQGGKIPDELNNYIADLGSANFMIIAATWLDNHPEGIEYAARCFREQAG
ncbi:RuBisCO large subunit C-terminal-like domain-containing protein [Gilvimarinus sp. SDUM040013]|uniref:RuBisCO large subunit C-terminal-like domain-containing protein n=1 Tax=Gilvimarinus gilvus TaxID=3058038 RepID=A0ABU4RWM6_9GAMM|nr:RuBisCO large subunit C-terminal-like domain-containing protein [Gilvimarinus sp. SDUM040013]MDO3387043.1 RuBisCO large subunit C-terminal-like domain-containing protein [Gilvimarinus sp. SDUM040013]MDX6848063.1 RuBisCO large subunit C-terminal-like domain-containing protein [Gilvimarinus sp. SDUM040013]